MKLVRYGLPGAEAPGLVDAEGGVRSLAGIVADIAGPALAPEVIERLGALDPAALPPAPPGARLGPCVGGAGKLVCIGLNYADHAAEAGVALPSEPIIFLKATSAIAGPDDPVEMPAGSEMMDWEVELGVVIGERARQVTEADALSHVAGYCVVNDYSERAWQLQIAGQWAKTGTQWTKGKSHDGFGPIGPWLVTADEVPDPQAFDLWLDVDGERMQDSRTASMVFGVAHLVSYVSRYMTLMPGDVIATGTPAGVGMGRKPETYLRPGQTVRLGISGLGQQEQRILPPSA